MRSIQRIGLFSLLFLQGCGFHLRGPAVLAPALKKMYVQSFEPFSLLTSTLKIALKNAGVRIVENKQEADTVLSILQETPTQQLLSVGTTQQTRQYSLILSANYQISSPQDKPLLPLQTVVETRSLTLQANKILGTSNEQSDLYQQMRQSIAYDIIDRLSADETTAQLNAIKLSHEN